MTAAAAEALAEIEARRSGDAPVRDEPEIGPEEEDAVQLFYALASQWRIHGMSGLRMGIEYTAIAPVAAMMGIGMTPRLFDDMRIMEGAALAAFPRK